MAGKKKSYTEKELKNAIERAVKSTMELSKRDIERLNKTCEATCKDYFDEIQKLQERVRELQVLVKNMAREMGRA